MGCICGKASAIEDSRGESPRERKLNKQSQELPTTRVTSSSRRQGSFRLKERQDSGRDIRVGLIDKRLNGSNRVRDDNFEKKRENSEEVPNSLAVGTIPKATEGEQVVAGWPSWFAAVAGEAIKGWVPRQADTFEKLDKHLILADWPRHL